MKKLLLRALFILIPFLYSIYLSAQPKKQEDCSTTCFSSEVVSVEKISGACTAYELKVSYSGACAHALSHFAVAVPCGTVETLWNSASWAQSIGTDPTTGLQGFKIDNISNFGEGSLTSFTVKFNVCTSGDECASQMSCWQPQVAYKASTCVNYETLQAHCQSLTASIEKTDVSCFNAQDGSLSVIAEEGREPYTYAWSNGSTTQSVSNLAAGAYSVIVRDQSGAEITLEETVSQPEAISVSGNATPATCNGVADGSIDVTISGGEAPYSIQWDNGAQTEDLQQVPSGQYTLIVKDANNCSTTSRFTVGGTSVMDITASHAKPDCNDSNGSIDITVTGGTPPYTFKWSDNIVTEDRNALPAGIYSVVVTDNSGCRATASYFIKENNTLKLDATTTAASCEEDTGAAIDLTVTGGTAPYSYTWSNGATDQDLVDISSGYYTVVVTDVKNCTATRSFPVSKNTFQVPRIVQQPTCHGEANGSITLQEPIGGTGPFTYQWSTGSESGPTLSGLGEGVYSVTVTDATGCSRTLTSTIKSPSEIFATANVSNLECNAEGAFSVDLTVSGGTAPYKFQWSNGSTSEDLSAVESGVYTVTITDAHGCSISREIIVEGQSTAWSCLISSPATMPVCGSENNTLSTPIDDADSYSWAVESSDGSWSITNANAPTISYTAGSENSTATFTLTLTKDGCSKSCSYALSSCMPQDDGAGSDPGDEEPGGEFPDGENPDGEEPGEDDGSGEDPNLNCNECFESGARLVAVAGDCRTYEMQVNTNGLCRHDLSHLTVAIPCGSISNYSNSEGWKMEFGKDATTGLYGLKVDGIAEFGKQSDSFTIRFTICSGNACDLSAWRPTVAYKAGQCVATETIGITADPGVEGSISVYPNPFSETVNFEWSNPTAEVNLQIIDQYGNTMSAITTPTGKADGYYIRLESAGLPKGMYYYRLTVGGKKYQGKISKR